MRIDEFLRLKIPLDKKIDLSAKIDFKARIYWCDSCYEMCGKDEYERNTGTCDKCVEKARPKKKLVANHRIDTF